MTEHKHTGHTHHHKRHGGHGEQAFDPNQLLQMEERRRTFMPPEQILNEFLTSPRMVLADMGCGVGYYSIPAGKILTGGSVYAIDLQQNMVDKTLERASEQGLANVHGVTASATELPLEDNTVDAVLMSMMFHDVPEQDRMLSEAKRILKSQGTLYMVEWDRVETDFGPPMEIRIRPDEITATLERAGFEIEDIHYSEQQKAIYYVHAHLPKQ